MLIERSESVKPTKNPLLYRNGENLIVFGTNSDLSKFSVKFGVFKDSYHENECVREAKFNKMQKPVVVSEMSKHV